jgi:hypothetical protein
LFKTMEFARNSKRPCIRMETVSGKTPWNVLRQ